MNGTLFGSGVNLQPPGLAWPPGRNYARVVQKLVQLKSPVDVFVAVDEHPDSINDSKFMFDPGKQEDQYSWRDLAASYHNGAAGFSFADGHSEIKKWVSEGTKAPIKRVSKWWGQALNDPYSEDLRWMNDKMPWR
jgi:prepilin-type processing-associated H-X9-DG protein